MPAAKAPVLLPAGADRLVLRTAPLLGVALALGCREAVAASVAVAVAAPDVTTVTRAGAGVSVSGVTRCASGVACLVGAAVGAGVVTGHTPRGEAGGEPSL